jgi:hypothetical protein
LRGPEATRQAVLQALPGITHLHFACHAPSTAANRSTRPWSSRARYRSLCGTSWTAIWTFQARGSRCSPPAIQDESKTDTCRMRPWAFPPVVSRRASQPS